MLKEFRQMGPGGRGAVALLFSLGLCNLTRRLFTKKRSCFKKSISPLSLPPHPEGSRWILGQTAEQAQDKKHQGSLKDMETDRTCYRKEPLPVLGRGLGGSAL